MKTEDKIKVNFRVVHDGVYSNIEATYEEVDNYEVFPSHTGAKKQLIINSTDRKNEWVAAIKYQRSLKKSDALEHLNRNNY